MWTCTVRSMSSMENVTGMENEQCENEGCGNDGCRGCAVWKMRDMENEEY